jgi:hypothetical protein
MVRGIARTKADFSYRRNDGTHAFKSMKSPVDGNAIDRVITWFWGVGMSFRPPGGIRLDRGIALKKYFLIVLCLFQNPTQLFNSRIQKGKNSRMQELLFNQDCPTRDFPGLVSSSVTKLQSYRP